MGGGDKVENSQDSRYWGLLPDDLIVGKASRVWKSKDPISEKIRWTEYQISWNDSANRIETELRQIIFWPIRFYVFHLLKTNVNPVE